ncbi:beta-ketoacyl synthase N-terminal-like domain-containing protein [Maribacter sp. CXY002]|uniref:beta-ketoacyl synthase N-terminal-like domain-containing protein n=1 Tax=Maribacter luteocoastalis TaxID=3407671 RepID=UPI003B67E3FE
MLNDKIGITAIASVSPLGDGMDVVWGNYQNKGHCFRQQRFNGNPVWVAPLQKDLVNKIEAIRISDSKYKNLDKSVLYALYASRNAIKIAGWKADDNFGINIGSSRGATALFEKYHEEYLNNGKTATLASPTTTLGNISSWVAHDLQTQGPEVSHSITCSTALHSLLNGIAWLKSGMANKFLVGGSEAPLTPFTIAQMQALKIYSKVKNESTGLVGDKESAIVKESLWGTERSQSYPCRALDLKKDKNSMILGEGASVACLEKGISNNTLAIIDGIGFATEPLEHNVSISTDADCFQRSMKMAMGATKPEEVDVIVMHAPGTIKGDQTEVNAIQKVFRDKMPFLTTNKWKIGHTFGASGMLSIELAVLMLQQQQAISVPYIDNLKEPKFINKVLVNAVGFGGNAVSVLVSKP